MSRERILAAAVLLTACGGAPPPTPAPAASESAPAAAPTASAKAADEADKPFTQLPTACDKQDDKICLPPAAFVKHLCGGAFPEVALAMFAKGTPWTRGYLRRETEAWNASGGSTSSTSDKMVLDEEVIFVAHRAADTGGMQVSGATGSYDVLRWDGTCASLMGDEVSTKPPAAPKSAKIPWRILSDALQGALTADEKIGKVAAERKKECKGATMGSSSGPCEKVDAKLSAAIAGYVRGGGSLPPPSKLP